jgi:diaminohydroxyphosphoribosylaminopyrimidine deaminase/5-amino-6-(5-phosphoribosylamino)uracil reductase
MEGAEMVTCSEENYLQDVLHFLFDIQVLSIMVEGGAITHQYFMDQGLFDEIRRFVSSEKITDGVAAPQITNVLLTNDSIIEGGDLLLTYQSLI